MKKTKQIPGREIPEWKKNDVKRLASEIEKARVIAIVDMSFLPAKQLQRIRAKLKSDMNLLMSKKAVITRAIKASKKRDLEALVGHVKGMSALLLTEMDPFKLSVTLDKERVPAPIKAGAVAENDIMINAGITPFMPGPAIADFLAFNIKTKVESGKIAVVSDTVVARKGSIVSDKLAGLLKRLDIKPIRVGLNLVSAWEDGHIYTGESLQISQSDYISRVQSAHQSAINLAYAMNMVTSETALMLLSKARTAAFNLAINLAILNDNTKLAILSLANSHAYALAHTIYEKDPKALSEGLSKHLAEIGIKEVFGGE